MRKLLPLTEENLGLLDNKPAEKVRKIFPELPLNDDDGCCLLYEDDAKKYYYAYSFTMNEVFCGGEVFIPLEENPKAAYMRFKPCAMVVNKLYQLGDVQIDKGDIADINRNMPIDDNMYLPLVFGESGACEAYLPVFSDQGRALICNAALSQRAGAGEVHVAFKEGEAFHKICFLRGGLCGLRGQF